MPSLGSGQDLGQLQGYLMLCSFYSSLLLSECDSQEFMYWEVNPSAKSHGNSLWKWAIEIRWALQVPLMNCWFYKQERPQPLALITLWCPLPGYDTARWPSAATMILDFPVSRTMSQSNCVFLHYPIFCVVLSATENGPSQLPKSDPVCLPCTSLQLTEVATRFKVINLKVHTLHLQGNYTLSCQIAGSVIFPII